MNVEKIFESFAPMQEYAESKNTNASLWCEYPEAYNCFKLKEYATTVEKVENMGTIKGDDRLMLDITLRFADNRLDKLVGHRHKGELKESKTYFSLGFCMKANNTTYYVIVSDFSEKSIVGEKYNHLKAYTETPAVQLSKLELIPHGNSSRLVYLQKNVYCAFDDCTAVSVNYFGQIVY